MSYIARFRLNWADKAALIASLAFLAVLFAITLAVLVAVGSAPKGRVLAFALEWGGMAELAFAAVTWILLRGIDLAGRSVRAGARTVRHWAKPAGHDHPVMPLHA